MFCSPFSIFALTDPFLMRDWVKLKVVGMMEVNNSLVTFVFRDKLLSLLQSKRGSIVKLHLVCWRIFHLIERKMIFSVLDSSFPTWDMILSRRRDNLIFSCRTVSHHEEVWSKQCPLKLFLGHLEMIQGICCLCSRSKLSFPWGLRRVSCFSLWSLDSLSTRSFFVMKAQIKVYIFDRQMVCGRLSGCHL